MQEKYNGSIEKRPEDLKRVTEFLAKKPKEEIEVLNQEAKHALSLVTNILESIQTLNGPQKPKVN